MSYDYLNNPENRLDPENYNNVSSSEPLKIGTNASKIIDKLNTNAFHGNETKDTNVDKTGQIALNEFNLLNTPSPVQRSHRPLSATPIGENPPQDTKKTLQLNPSGILRGIEGNESDSEAFKQASNDLEQAKKNLTEAQNSHKSLKNSNESQKKIHNANLKIHSAKLNLFKASIKFLHVKNEEGKCSAEELQRLPELEARGKKEQIDFLKLLFKELDFEINQLKSQEGLSLEQKEKLDQIEAKQVKLKEQFAVNQLALGVLKSTPKLPPVPYVSKSRDPGRIKPFPSHIPPPPSLITDSNHLPPIITRKFHDLSKIKPFPSNIPPPPPPLINTTLSPIPTEEIKEKSQTENVLLSILKHNNKNDPFQVANSYHLSMICSELFNTEQGHCKSIEIIKEFGDFSKQWVLDLGESEETQKKELSMILNEFISSGHVETLLQFSKKTIEDLKSYREDLNQKNQALTNAYNANTPTQSEDFHQALEEIKKATEKYVLQCLSIEVPENVQKALAEFNVGYMKIGLVINKYQLNNDWNKNIENFVDQFNEKTNEKLNKNMFLKAPSFIFLPVTQRFPKYSLLAKELIKHRTIENESLETAPFLKTTMEANKRTNDKIREFETEEANKRELEETEEADKREFEEADELKKLKSETSEHRQRPIIPSSLFSVFKRIISETKKPTLALKKTKSRESLTLSTEEKSKISSPKTEQLSPSDLVIEEAQNIISDTSKVFPVHSIQTESIVSKTEESEQKPKTLEEMEALLFEKSDMQAPEEQKELQSQFLNSFPAYIDAFLEKTKVKVLETATPNLKLFEYLAAKFNDVNTSKEAKMQILSLVQNWINDPDLNTLSQEPILYNKIEDLITSARKIKITLDSGFIETQDIPLVKSLEKSMAKFLSNTPLAKLDRKFTSEYRIDLLNRKIFREGTSYLKVFEFLTEKVTSKETSWVDKAAIISSVGEWIKALEPLQKANLNDAIQHFITSIPNDNNLRAAKHPLEAAMEAPIETPLEIDMDSIRNGKLPNYTNSVKKMASQLASIKAEMFKSIPLFEFSLYKEIDGQATPHIQAIINSHDQLKKTIWDETFNISEDDKKKINQDLSTPKAIVQHKLQQQKLQQQISNVIKFFIDIQYELVFSQDLPIIDYDTAWAINSFLTEDPFLRRFLENLPKETRKKMNRMESLFSVDKNSQKLQEATKAQTKPYIPLTSLLTKGLTFASDGNPGKIKTLGEIVNQLKNHQKNLPHSKNPVANPYDSDKTSVTITKKEEDLINKIKPRENPQK